MIRCKVFAWVPCVNLQVARLQLKVFAIFRGMFNMFDVIFLEMASGSAPSTFQVGHMNLWHMLCVSFCSG